MVIRARVLSAVLLSLVSVLGAGEPRLWRRVEVPAALRQTQPRVFGGDLRIGDLTGDGKVDFLIHRSKDGTVKPSFLGAFTLEGDILWSAGSGGGQPERPGPVTVYDFDGDGRDEVLCFFSETTDGVPPDSLSDVVIQLRDGRTGRILRQAKPPVFEAIRGSGPNWVHQRLLVANFRGTSRSADFAVKLGEHLLAFDDHLRPLWRYLIPWNEYSWCSAYIPAVGDLDGDNRDEVNGGYYLMDSDGSVIWQGQIGRNMDSVAISEWGGGRMRAIASGYGHVLDARGNVVLRLGEQEVPHGQEARVADFAHQWPGPEMVVRWNGHTPDVILVSNDGQIRRRFRLNSSPNETGMETVYWSGRNNEALLYNGGMLWRGTGEPYAKLPGLPRPAGPAKMGWYHAIPADLVGDEGEELVLYNPWDFSVYIYTGTARGDDARKPYRAGSRQYNARLMD
jgi:hypothetical protein